jgi:ubiquinone/menaquinone biosynthesis C-methylase UbiE
LGILNLKFRIGNRGIRVKTEPSVQNLQKKFDFSPQLQRPFLSNLPARIDTYEEGVARFFGWRTGLDYYLAMDQIVDFVVSTGRVKVIDLLTDTATFALRLAARKAFVGRIYSFDSNVTLLERAKQRAAHLSLQQFIEFKHVQESRVPVPDGYGELAVSIFDLHRHYPEQYLAEAMRVLAPNGYLVLAELLMPKSVRKSLHWLLKNLHLRYVQKNPTEAKALYYDKEEIIELLFKTGFRQIIIQGLNAPASRHPGVFSLIAATK